MQRFDIPCLKYMINKVADDSDLLMFCIFFYSILSQEGLTISQLATEFLSKVPLFNESGVDMRTLNGKALDETELMQRASLESDAVVKPCSKYCKNKLEADYGNICKTCHRSGSIYANDFEKEEYALLRYALEKTDNFMQVEQWIRNNKCIFRSLTDIVSDIDYQRPVVIPLTFVLFHLVKKSGSFFKTSDIKTNIESSEVETHFWARLTKQDPEIKSIKEQNGKLAEVVFKTLTGNILSANLPTEKEGADIIDAMVSAHGTARNASAKTGTKNKGIPDQRDIFELLEQVSEEPEKTENITDNVTEHAENVPEPEQPVVQTDEVEEEYVEPSVESKDIPEDSPVQDAIEEEPYEEYVSEYGEDDAYVDEQEYPLGVPYDYEYGEPMEENVPSSPADDLNKGLLYIPQVNPLFINGMTAYFENEQLVVSMVTRNHVLPYEIVKADNKTYFIIYVYGLDRFVYAETTRMSKTLAELFHKKNIYKVTWQPYYTYSIFKMYGVVVRDVYSILRWYFITNPDRKCGGYEKTVQEEIKENLPPRFEGTGSKLADMYIQYIPSYNNIRMHQLGKLSDEKTGTTELLFDEILGNSYLRKRNFMTDDTLFEMDLAGRIVFNDKYDIRVKGSGCLMSYGINCAKMDNREKRSMFEQLLISIYTNANYRKYNYQIVRIGNDNITIFCEDRIFDALKSYIRTYLDEYAIDSGYVNFNHFASHKHLGPAKKMTEVIPIEYPRSIVRAQDILTTPHDKITVGEKRIRINRDGTTRRRQKEDFPKKTVKSNNKK